MKLTFLGATQTVTGSKFLLEFDDHKILVDCGLFQGYKELRLRNWRSLPISAKEITAVILTHAHIDHSGYLPLLIKNGFRGKVFSTKATRDLCSILLPDSGYLHEEEARFANKYGFSKHKPALPLYTRDEAEEALNYFEPVDFEKEYQLDKNTRFKFSPAGHILGAAFVLITHHHKTILFSGDMGRPRHPLMYPPAQMTGADYLVLESTYGNRRHEHIKPLDQIANVVNEAVSRGGCVLVPAFAVGRSQTFLFDINKLKKRGRIPDIPVYLDSPLATRATKIFCRHTDETKLKSKNDCYEVFNVATYIETPAQSKMIDAKHQPMIIVSASGMATGGRILHHLKAFAPDPRNAILFTGYQACGTRGARIVYGEKEVKIHGKMVPINASVHILNNVSAHADSDEVIDWLSHFTHRPKTTFLVHGEPASAAGLKERISHQFGWHCEIPKYKDSVQLIPHKIPS